MTDEELLENNKKVEAQWKAYLEESDKKFAPILARKKKRLELCAMWLYITIFCFLILIFVMCCQLLMTSIVVFFITLFSWLVCLHYDDSTDSKELGPTDYSDGYF